METRSKFAIRRLFASGAGAVLAIAAFLTGAAILPFHPDRASAQNTNDSPVGTWINSVLVNTPSGPQPLATELATFNPGGTFIDTISIAHSSQNPAFTGPLAPLAADFSDAFGTWKQDENNSSQFHITFKRFIFAGANTPPSAYGSFFPGQNVGTATIEAVATLQTSAAGDTLSGPYTFQLTNLQGTVVLSAGGTFSATRLRIQPLATP